MKRFIHLPLPTILILTHTLLTLARLPANWGTLINPTTTLNAARMRDGSPSTFVSGGPDTPHLADIIGTCKNEQGGIVAKAACQQSVLETGVCMGLSVVGSLSSSHHLSSGPHVSLSYPTGHSPTGPERSVQMVTTNVPSKLRTTSCHASPTISK